MLRVILPAAAGLIITWGMTCPVTARPVVMKG